MVLKAFFHQSIQSGVWPPGGAVGQMPLQSTTCEGGLRLRQEAMLAVFGHLMSQDETAI